MEDGLRRKPSNFGGNLDHVALGLGMGYGIRLGGGCTTHDAPRHWVCR